MSKPIYSAVFLKSHSKQKLLDTFPAKHPKVFAEHMTIKFGLTKDDIDNLPVGKEVKLSVHGYSEDEKGQAVLVIAQGVHCSNPNPHITISCENGIKPVYSNELIKQGFEHCQSLELDGIVDFFPRTI